MGKLKELKEKRATVFGEIDELRKAADGREMTAEEQQKWDALLGDYDRADRLVAQEERFEDIQKRQAEQAFERAQTAGNNDGADGTGVGECEYRAAFVEYLSKGENGVSAENRKLFESRAGITGLAGGVIVPSTLASSIEKALKTYGGMLEAKSCCSTAGGMLPATPTGPATTA